MKHLYFIAWLALILLDVIIQIDMARSEDQEPERANKLFFLESAVFIFVLILWP